MTSVVSQHFSGCNLGDFKKKWMIILLILTDISVTLLFPDSDSYRKQHLFSLYNTQTLSLISHKEDCEQQTSQGQTGNSRRSHHRKVNILTNWGLLLIKAP